MKYQTPSCADILLKYSTSFHSALVKRQCHFYIKYIVTYIHVCITIVGSYILLSLLLCTLVTKICAFNFCNFISRKTFTVHIYAKTFNLK